MIDVSRPIFLQIAEMIENDIGDGVLVEEAQAPSTNEFAAFHRINPATAAKGVNRLVDDGILHKKRGIGMFVATGARVTLIGRRQEVFYEQFVRPGAMRTANWGSTACNSPRCWPANPNLLHRWEQHRTLRHQKKVPSEYNGCQHGKRVQGIQDVMASDGVSLSLEREKFTVSWAATAQGFATSGEIS